MPLLMDIEEATAEGRAISGLYEQLRRTCSLGERAAILRQVGDYADALGRKLRSLAEQQAQKEPDENVKAALARLGDAMEQVMVQEREYRMASGAPPDSAETSPGGEVP